MRWLQKRGSGSDENSKGTFPWESKRTLQIEPVGRARVFRKPGPGDEALLLFQASAKSRVLARFGSTAF